MPSPTSNQSASSSTTSNNAITNNISSLPPQNPLRKRQTPTNSAPQPPLPPTSVPTPNPAPAPAQPQQPSTSGTTNINTLPPVNPASKKTKRNADLMTEDPCTYAAKNDSAGAKNVGEKTNNIVVAAGKDDLSMSSSINNTTYNTSNDTSNQSSPSTTLNSVKKFKMSPPEERSTDFTTMPTSERGRRRTPVCYKEPVLNA